MDKRFVTVRGKVCNSDDIYELPEFASELYLDAEDQRFFASRMRENIKKCREAGYSWDEIGLLVGLPRETVFRQYMSGGDIWVGRGTHKRKEEE